MPRTPSGHGHRVPIVAGPSNGLGIAGNERHTAAGYQSCRTYGQGGTLPGLLRVDRTAMSTYAAWDF